MSIDRLIATAPLRLAPGELDMTEISLGDLPLYNRDYDNDYPPVARTFKDALTLIPVDEGDPCDHQREGGVLGHARGLMSTAPASAAWQHHHVLTLHCGITAFILNRLDRDRLYKRAKYGPKAALRGGTLIALRLVSGRVWRAVTPTEASQRGYYSRSMGHRSVKRRSRKTRNGMKRHATVRL